MASYANAAKQSGASNNAVPLAKKEATTAAAQVGPVKVTGILKRKGEGPPSNTSAKNSPHHPAKNNSPSPAQYQQSSKKSAGKGGKGNGPKNAGNQQQSKKKKNGPAPQSAAAGKKKSSPSQQPSSKKQKPNNSHKTSFTLGDLITTPQLSKKNKAPSTNKQPKQAQHLQQQKPHAPTAKAAATTTPHRGGAPDAMMLPLTNENFPSLSASSSTLSTTTPASAGSQGKKKQTVVPSSSKIKPGASTSNPSPVKKHPPTGTQKPAAKKPKATPSPKPSKTAKVAATTPAVSSQHHADGFLKVRNATSDVGTAGAAAARDNQGGEHDLLRLVESRKIILAGGGGAGQSIISKGRQRIRPRKKKFTALKKKVLEERLRKWRELHPEEVEAENNDAKHGDSEMDDTHNVVKNTSCTVCIHGFADAELLEYDDEYEELVNNLHEMATKVGECKRTFIPRSTSDNAVPPGGTTGGGDISLSYPAFVEFTSPSDAGAAVSCWDGLALGGSPIKAQHTRINNHDTTLLSTEEWQHECLTTTTKPKVGEEDASPEKSANTQTARVVLENVLTEDDLEDEDCLAETISDCRILAERFGVVDDMVVEREAMQLLVVYRGGLPVARAAAKALGQTVIAGLNISATVVGDESFADAQTSSEDRVILLHGALTDDDLEDEECLEESLNDLRELALQFGPVENIAMAEEGAAVVRIQFSGPREDITKTAVDGFNGMVIAGVTVRASLPGDLDSTVPETTAAGESIPVAPKPEKVEEKEPSPMFSGDKRIPERFAECKRVPKIPNASPGAPRHYAVLTGNDDVKPLLIEMLGELMRLQKRAVEDKNARARRRLVMGLREVARGIRSHKTKMVVMANNLDEYGVIDDKLQQILDLCREEGVPVFFEFNKKGLGKAIGKTIKIAVVGVQNAEGAHQQFKKLVRLAPALPC